jgi:hypothetical protein
VTRRDLFRVLAAAVTARALPGSEFHFERRYDSNDLPSASYYRDLVVPASGSRGAAE